jgi:hypothetical protein
MKKIYMLAVTAIFTTTAFAQNKHVVLNENSSVTIKEQAALDQLTIKKTNSIQNQSTNKKGAVNGRVDFPAALLNTLGSSLEYGASNPMMPDSTTNIEYSNFIGAVTNHAVGMVYDPTDAFFGANQFTASDAVTVDSLFIDGFYYLYNTAHTNDSIIFTVMVGNPASSPFAPITFSGLTGLTGPQTTIPYFVYAGSAAHGRHQGLTGTINSTFGYELVHTDTTGSAQISVATGGITIPAGQVMGVFVEFIPTSTNPGDTASLVNDTGNHNLFRPISVRNANSGTDYNNFTALDAGSNQHNSINLGNETRYLPSATSTSHVGGTSYVLSQQSYSVYATVSGNSSVGINELNDDVRVNVYPNPSAGVFNINLASNEANTASVSVKNIVGQTILNETVNVSGNTNHTISLADYSKGVYFLTVNQETVKLIVE